MITKWYYHCVYTKGNTDLFPLHRHKSTTQFHCSHRLFQQTYQINIQSMCHWLEVRWWSFWHLLVTFATRGQSTKYTYLYYKTVSFCPPQAHARTHARTHARLHACMHACLWPHIFCHFCMYWAENLHVIQEVRCEDCSLILTFSKLIQCGGSIFHKACILPTVTVCCTLT